MGREPTSFGALKAIAAEHGFPWIGWVDLSSAREEYSKHAREYQDWIKAGRHGEMSYLERRLPERLDPEVWAPEMQSVLCVARPYSARPHGSRDIRSARYLGDASGRDYHHALKTDLERTLTEWRRKESETQEVRWQIGVDSSPVMERTWGALCGLGWIGKNGCLIHPTWGSFFFLGVAFLNIAAHRKPELLPDYCGSCMSCIKGCPTQAIVEPRIVDARRCIAYWTLEHRSTLDLSPQDQGAIGSWVAGCDICQEVCPFNRKRMKSECDPVEQPFDWDRLAGGTEEEYRGLVKDSALSRVKWPMFKRNVEWVRFNRKSKSVESK